MLFEGVDLLCMSGPVCLLLYASRQLAGRLGAATYEIGYFSANGGLLASKQGLVVETCPLGKMNPRDYDTVIIPGGDSELWCDPEIVAWVARHRGDVRRIAAISCGAYYLAAAGLLDGRSATTHWDEFDSLQACCPTAKIVRDCIFVRDEQIWTSAGAASGLDLALAMIEEDHGHELAMLVARRSIMFMKRAGGDPQFSPQLEAQAVEGPLAPLIKWIVTHPEADLRAEALAERANMSLRNFYRAFGEATGTTPADWVENLRMGVATRLLEQTHERIDQIARRAGFLNDERMRRCFIRRLGMTPAAYRETHAQAAPAPAGRPDVSLLAGAYGLAAGDSLLRAEMPY